MSNHSGSVFNNSCLKVPLNPSNRQPSPLYERGTFDTGTAIEGKTYVRRRQGHMGIDGKVSRPQSWSPSADSGRNAKLREGSTPRSVMLDGRSRDSFDSFMNFYENIPDYGELGNLPDGEFYLRLQALKDKHMLYCKSLTAENPALENKPTETEPGNGETQVNSAISNTSGSVLGGSAAPYAAMKESSIADNSKKNERKKFQKKSQSKTISHDYINWEKLAENTHLVSPSSVTSIDHKSTHRASVNDSSLLDSVDATVNLHQKGNRNEHQLNSFKIKEKKTNGVTNMKREIHSAFSNKHTEPCKSNSRPTSSLRGNTWDNLSANDCLTKLDYLFSDSDSEYEEPLLQRSLPSSPILKHNRHTTMKEPNITVPKPFKMTLRDEEERRLNVLRNELYEDDDKSEEEKSIFRANPVPLHTHMPLYDKIMAQQERRRKKLRKQFIAELQSQMKPFSFVVRDEERKKLSFFRSTPDLSATGENKFKPFRAKPVPKNLFGSHVYQKMREDEFYRSLKRKIRAEELLQSASLPPSMAAREQLEKDLKHIRAQREDYSDSLDIDRRIKNKQKIPNYKKLHEKMSRELEHRFDENITTSPHEFRLQTANIQGKRSKLHSPPSDNSSVSPYGIRLSTEKEKPRPHSALSVMVNRNNLAAILRIQSARQRLENELLQKQEEIRRKEEARLRARFIRRQPAWRALNFSTAEDLELRLQSRREEERIRREEFLQDMEIMLDRVQQIPPLFARQCQAGMKEKFKKQKNEQCKPGLKIAVHDIPKKYQDYGHFSPSAFSDDKCSKLGLKVSINENAETIACESECEDDTQGITKCQGVKIEEIVEDKSEKGTDKLVESKQQTGNIKTEDCPEDDDCDYTESFQDASDDKSSHTSTCDRD
ncbi:protein FAM161B-like [Schistocerca americana]|uniref:protein FAM161B-like n=1 Tax=Schistocerca americana TaxID=7009 RepID=UPI001F4FCB63|nr:protein FAM161B-like [Schistocerca americana]